MEYAERYGIRYLTVHLSYLKELVNYAEVTIFLVVNCNYKGYYHFLAIYTLSYILWSMVIILCFFRSELNADVIKRLPGSNFFF